MSIAASMLLMFAPRPASTEPIFDCGRAQPLPVSRVVVIVDRSKSMDDHKKWEQLVSAYEKITDFIAKNQAQEAGVERGNLPSFCLAVFPHRSQIFPHRSQILEWISPINAPEEIKKMTRSGFTPLSGALLEVFEPKDTNCAQQIGSNGRTLVFLLSDNSECVESPGTKGCSDRSLSVWDEIKSKIKHYSGEVQLINKVINPPDLDPGAESQTEHLRGLGFISFDEWLKRTETVSRRPVGDDSDESALDEDVFDDVALVGDKHRWHCTGILISPRVVLTARHCLPATRVRFTHDARTAGTIHEVIDTAIPSDPALDGALLLLKQEVKNDFHRRRKRQEPAPPEGSLRAVGYGAIDASGRWGFGRKRTLDLPSLGWGCTGSRAARLGCSPERELFIPGGGGIDTCSGDSGGPVFEVLMGEEDADGRVPCQWRLVGITSRGAQGGRTACGHGGIYVRLDKLDEFITTTLERWKVQHPSTGESKP